MSEPKSNKNLIELLVSLETSTDENYRLIRDEIYGLSKPSDYALLREDLKHPNYRRRMAAATNLGRHRDRESYPDLIQLLSDPIAEVREMAVFALGLLGKNEACAPLIDLLSDYNADVRYRILVALNELRYPMLEVVLIRAMNDEAFSVREHAMTLLKKVGTSKSATVVLKALLERDYGMQQHAEEVLDRLVPMLSDASYLLITEGLSLRERRLVINYFENKNLQVVYPKLYEVLHVGYSSPPASKLSKYGRVLNDSNELEMLQRAYLRNDVVDEIYQHFCEENRHSILLVGDAGAGKTSIAHEVARRLIGEQSNDLKKRSQPVKQKDKWTILETSTTELITETRFLGEWETKLKKMMEAIEEVDGNVLVYLTNPNDLLGAGAHSNSDENFADFFRPYLQRGLINIIAETTESELRTGLAKEPGFLRLFKQIRIPTMTSSQTREVVKEKLEQKDLDLVRNLRVPAKQTLKNRYQEPDKTKFIPSFSATPEVIDSIVYYSSSFMTRTSQPGAACDLLNQIVDMKRITIEKENRKNASEDEEESTKENQNYEIRIEDVTDCLSKNTGLPLNILDPTRKLDLTEAKEWFKSRLIGQEHAIDEIINRLAIIKAGLNDPTRPLAVYFLVGPTGVGKTYLSKLLAKYLFGDEERLLRFDLSEYQGVYAVEKLLGSPHDKQHEGLLTEAVKNQPFSVLLLDEFEKANKDIFSLFLQVFDDARLTDAGGNTTDFRQTVILITSNLGASKTSVTGLGFGTDTLEGMRGRINDKLGEFFAPEFLNRLDRVIPFDPLDESSIEKLVDIEVKTLLERRGISANKHQLELTTEARMWLAKNGFSDKFGARHLRRAIEQHIVPSIARLIISDGQHSGKTIQIRLHKEGDPDHQTELFATWSPKSAKTKKSKKQPPKESTPPVPDDREKDKVNQDDKDLDGVDPSKKRKRNP